MVLCWHQDYQTLRKNDVHVDPSTDPLQLKLTNGGRIRGVIIDGSTGKPVAGARLSASDVADIHKDAVSQEDGAFVLAGLTTSGRSVTVNVTADGFARLRKDVKAEENREVEENFELQPTGIVTGRVVNSAGDGIPGARVQAKRAAESGSVEQTLTNDVTDREGKYELRGIDAGENNWIRVKKSEFLDGSSEAFAIEPSQALELPPIVLQLGGSLAGKVVGPDGNPITDCMVIVTHEGETEVAVEQPILDHEHARRVPIQGLGPAPWASREATHFPPETRVPNVGSRKAFRPPGYRDQDRAGQLGERHRRRRQGQARRERRHHGEGLLAGRQGAADVFGRRRAIHRRGHRLERRRRTRGGARQLRGLLGP
jgi:hypothetical protein